MSTRETKREKHSLVKDVTTIEDVRGEVIEEPPLLRPDMKRFVVDYVFSGKRATLQKLAKKYGVHVRTAESWLKRDDVQQYLRWLQQNDDEYLKTASREMLKKAVSRSLKILSLPINDDNISKLSSFVLGVLQLYRPGVNVLVNSLASVAENDNQQEIDEAVALMREARSMSASQLRREMQELQHIDEVVDEEEETVNRVNNRRGLKTMSDLM